MRQYQEYNDNELLMLIAEKNEAAENILLKKYNYLIELLVKKYEIVAKSNKIELQDLYQTALLGYYDAVENYNCDLSAFPTFVTLCITRKIRNLIDKNTSIKNKLYLSNLPLNYIFNDNINYIVTEDNNNPEYIISESDSMIYTINKIKKELSKREKDVFILLINGYSYLEISNILSTDKKKVDNTIQRVKRKIKKMIN